MLSDFKGGNVTSGVADGVAEGLAETAGVPEAAGAVLGIKGKFLFLLSYLTADLCRSFFLCNDLC